ncbi:MAG: hypothetical protein MUF54_20775, partial [Polyangiaceae bacterium]|nr:hypothetical protein [Polyangiaceae bacterium]
MADGLAILALSQTGRKWREGLAAHAKFAGHSLHGFDKTSDALSWLDDHEPRAIVVDADTLHAATLVVLARAKPALADVPILALVPALDDHAFARLLAVGADDVLPAPTVQRIVDRIETLRRAHSLRPPADRGVAVVADTDPTRCDVLGRILAHAGYEVRLALDLASLEGYAAEPDVQLVVATTDLGDPERLIPRVRQGGSLPAWVVTDPTLDPWANPRPVSGRPRVMRMSTRAQPDSVLFVSNALLLASGRTARGSSRLLYGTSVGFRATGAAADDYGFSYNIGAQGLFVRTLAPPPPGNVSLELEPPGHGKRLRFVGEIVWT